MPPITLFSATCLRAAWLHTLGRRHLLFGQQSRSTPILSLAKLGQASGGLEK